jgi:phage gp46-like protein
MSVPLTIVDQTVTAPNLLWDTVWDGFVGDWEPAGSAEPSNRGGLRSTAPLPTAILLCLMSDRRAKPNDFIQDGSGDPRGWPGDAIDTSIAPLGSRLWQLRRRELTDAIANLAVIFAREALQTLIDQGVVASIDVTADAVLDVGRLELGVSLFRQNGQLAAAMNFWILWSMSSGVVDPLLRRAPPPPTSILTEDGNFLLLEDGSRMLLGS